MYPIAQLSPTYLIALRRMFLPLIILCMVCTEKVYFNKVTTHILFKQISFYVFPKRFSQASLLTLTTYFQNRIMMFCLELLYFVEKYSTRCSHSAVIMGNKIFPVVHEIHISRYELQRWSLEFDLAFRFG